MKKSLGLSAINHVIFYLCFVSVFDVSLHAEDIDSPASQVKCSASLSGKSKRKDCLVYRKLNILVSDDIIQDTSMYSDTAHSSFYHLLLQWFILLFKKIQITYTFSPILHI